MKKYYLMAIILSLSIPSFASANKLENFINSVRYRQAYSHINANYYNEISEAEANKIILDYLKKNTAYSEKICNPRMIEESEYEACSRHYRDKEASDQFFALLSKAEKQPEKYGADVGIAYTAGLGTEIDYDKADTWFKTSFEKGNSEAGVLYAHSLMMGNSSFCQDHDDECIKKAKEIALSIDNNKANEVLFLLAFDDAMNAIQKGHLDHDEQKKLMMDVFQYVKKAAENNLNAYPRYLILNSMLHERTTLTEEEKSKLYLVVSDKYTSISAKKMALKMLRDKPARRLLGRVRSSMLLDYGFF